MWQALDSEKYFCDGCTERERRGRNAYSSSWVVNLTKLFQHLSPFGSWNRKQTKGIYLKNVSKGPKVIPGIWISTSCSFHRDAEAASLNAILDSIVWMHHMAWILPLWEYWSWHTWGDLVLYLVTPLSELFGIAWHSRNMAWRHGINLNAMSSCF